MTFSSTLYYVEVQEGESVKIVPHSNDKKSYKFINRKQCFQFLESLRKKYPGKKFRYIKERIEYTQYSW